MLCYYQSTNTDAQDAARLGMGGAGGRGVDVELEFGGSGGGALSARVGLSPRRGRALSTSLSLSGIFFCLERHFFRERDRERVGEREKRDLGGGKLTERVFFYASHAVPMGIISIDSGGYP